MENKKSEKYTISVFPKTWERIAAMKKHGDSMDDVLNRLLDMNVNNSTN